MSDSSRVVQYLRGWVGVVGIMAFGNTLSCFRGHNFLAERLYTGAADLVNPLHARTFGVWTLLAAVLRVYCAYDIKNKGIYNMTFFSFILALGHFLSEAFIYKTAPLTVGVAAPLFVSGVSVIWMLLGYSYLDPPVQETDWDGPKSTRDIPWHKANKNK